MKLATASALSRAIACPGSQSLPHFDTKSEWSGQGDAIHAYLADSAHDLSKVPEQYREACENIDLAALPKGEWAAEVAFAWDYETDTGRELGRNLKRDYPATKPSEYRGTADVVGVTRDEVVILDYKSGYAKMPRENWQLRLLALAASRAYNRPSARVAIVRTWSLEKFRPLVFDALDLAEFAAQLRAMPAMWAGEPSFVQGDHCEHCPAFASCPAKLALWQTAGVTGPQITEENAAAVYQRADAVAQVLSRVRSGLAIWAKDHPIQLPDGMVYGPVMKEREAVDPFVVQAVLTKLHGPEVAAKAMDLDTSKAAIGRAIATIAPKGKKAKMIDEVLKAVEEQHGIVVTKKESIEEHRMGGQASSHLGTEEEQLAAGRKVVVLDESK